MPLFLVEREYVEQMKLAELGLGALDAQDVEEGLRWVFSFLSADQRKSYCLFEAPTAEVVWAAARRSGLPEAVVVEVDRVEPGNLPVGPPQR
ncbi:DUF4242 domain-containing protein [Frankia sp. AiPs1]|uniref:nickel-binding protein n=1 Tax=Frankia sp. AiPs1 TaxID=573493 RepID=UPI002044BADA|nr:nickel-binding protein [Frankia sp. AiPs1]MCM3920082.1 DUF4242 domain-containing protein [Frankia sp. AiPs1]